MRLEPGTGQPDSITGDPCCFGKTPYPTKAAALFVLKRRAKRRVVARAGWGSFEPYHCPECGTWHLGSGRGKAGR